MKRSLLFLTLLTLLCRFSYGQETNGNYWKPDTNQETNMGVIAVVKIDNVEQRGTNIELGAFCGETLVGSKRLQHIFVEESNIDRYMAYITIYGNNGDVITFKVYDHEKQEVLNYVTDNTVVYEVNKTIGSTDNPFEIFFEIPPYTFDEDAVWDESTVPTDTEDVIIDADVTIAEGSLVEINNLVVNEGKSLTIENGAVLTVNGTLTNADVNALVIEEGGQIFQNSDNVAATFRNNIENPTGNWGEVDKTGWQFVASPVSNANVNGFIPANGDYDLYMYDGTKEYQWINFKQLGSVSYDFSSNPFSNGWTSIDADGDGNNWKYKSRKPQYVYSVSYNEDDGDIFAQNYLVTPQFKVNDGTRLVFNAYMTYDDPDYPETFKVLLSENSNSNTDDFSAVLESYRITNTSAKEFVIDLSEYAGKDVYVAFYHYVEEMGSEQLVIKDVTISNENYFESGRGYLVSYQSESVSDFKGELNNEASYTMKANAYSSDNNLANFSLLGNPYPFDIDWKANVAVEGVYDGYAMIDSKDGSYKYYTDGFIRTGEGFMVKSVEGQKNEVTISKTKTRSLAEDSYINIVSTGKNGSDNLIVRFGEKENGGFQKMENFNKGVALLYVNDDKYSYGIYSYSNDVTEIPVHFKAQEMGAYTLTFDIQGEFENLYLLDKVTGVSVNMLLEKEYSFMTGSKDAAERFIITTSIGTTPDSVQNFVYVNNAELIVNDINGDAAINIYDVMGRCVYETNCTDAMNHISMEGFNAGTYIIQKIDDKGVRTQKFVFNR